MESKAVFFSWLKFITHPAEVEFYFPINSLTASGTTAIARHISVGFDFDKTRIMLYIHDKLVIY